MNLYAQSSRYKTIHRWQTLMPSCTCIQRIPYHERIIMTFSRNAIKFYNADDAGEIKHKRLSVCYGAAVGL